MTTKLPALVPFNDPVTVCSACGKAACVQRNLPKIRCAARKAGPVATKLVPLAEVQACPVEHFSYWKGDPNRDPDMPLDLADLREMIRVQRQQPDKWGDARQMMIGYLTVAELGIDPEQVAEAMTAEWPEGAVPT